MSSAKSKREYLEGIVAMAMLQDSAEREKREEMEQAVRTEERLTFSYAPDGVTNVVRSILAGSIFTWWKPDFKQVNFAKHMRSCQLVNQILDQW